MNVRKFLLVLLNFFFNFADFIYKILSFKYAHVFEKLTPINLLITPIIIRLLLFTADVPIYWSTGQTVSKNMKTNHKNL